MRGTINGVGVFLSEAQGPAFSSSINQLQDPSKIKGIVSNTLRVINTPEAARVLCTEYMGQISPTNQFVLQLPSGFTTNAIPVKHTRDEIECISAGGNASWFQQINAMKVRAMDLGNSPNVTAAYQRTTWTDEDDIVVFPLVDFGSFETRSGSFNVTPSKLRPALRVHRLLEEAFATFGYTIRACGSLADIWTKFITAQSNEAQSLVDGSDDEVANSQQGTASEGCATSVIGNVPGFFHRSTGGVGTPWDPGVSASTQHYLVPFDTTIRVTVSDFNIPTVPMALDGTRLRFVLYDKGSGYVIEEIAGDVLVGGAAYSIGTPDLAFTDVQVDSGTELDVGIWNETASSETITIGLPTVVQFRPLTKPYEVGVFVSPLVIASAGPDMTVAEVLSGVNKINCLAFNTDPHTKRVDVWLDREFFRVPTQSITTRDWTTRLDHSDAPAKLSEVLCERIEFRYKLDKNDRGLLTADRRHMPVGYGNHDAVIGGPKDPQKIETSFAATGMVRTFDGLLIPGIRKKGEVFQQDDYDHSPRILIMDGVAAGDWTHNTDAMTDYPKCYFVHPDTDSIPLHFDNGSVYFTAPDGTIATRWDRRLRELKNAKVLEAHLFIHDHEIQDFDHGMPTLVDDGSGPRWYYVQEIMGHRFGLGQPTKCKLVEIPGADIATAEIVNPAIEYPVDPTPIAFTFSSDKSGAITGNVTTTSGYFTVRDPDGNLFTYPSGNANMPDPGGVNTLYEVWASNAAGVPTGVITDAQLDSTNGADNITTFTPVHLGLMVTIYLNTNPDLTEFDTSSGMPSLTTLDLGITALDDLDLVGAPNLGTLSTVQTQLVALDLSPCVVLQNIDAGLCASLVAVTPPPNQTLRTVTMGACAMDAASVSGIIAACDPSHAGGTLTIDGGTNAIPSGADLPILAALASGSDLTVSGAGAASVNFNDYVLTTPQNGRDRYTRTGVFIFWNGTNWRIQSGVGDIYEGTEDVAQPWLVTTWNAIGGTATPVPTLTQPYAGGWSISTN